jgi:hypothetical protein
VDAGGPFAAALDRFLATLPAPLQPVTVALVLASDAPCRFETTAFNLSYHLVRASFPGGKPKQVLRFEGGGPVVREAAVEVPGNALVKTAVLKTSPSFRNGGSAAPVPGPGLASQTGVRVGGGRQACQRMSLEGARTVQGLSLAVLSLADRTALDVGLQEDHGGRPSGRALLEGSVTLDEAGRRAWVNVPAADALLPSGRYWVVVRTGRGQAVWLTAEGTEPLLVLGQTEGVLEGCQALHRLLARGPADTPELAVLVGDQEAAAAGETHDLAPALAQHLATLPKVPSLVSVPIRFRSTASGLVTVYPPRIEYDL